MQGGILATTCPMTCSSDPRTSQHMRVNHSTQFWAILVRESRERKWIKLIASWESWSWPKGFHFWTTLLNIFQGILLRFFDVFPYFHVWGNRKCQEKILFHKEKMSFWAFKNSVHLGLKEQIFTRFFVWLVWGLWISKSGIWWLFGNPYMSSLFS